MANGKCDNCGGMSDVQPLEIYCIRVSTAGAEPVTEKKYIGDLCKPCRNAIQLYRDSFKGEKVPV